MFLAAFVTALLVFTLVPKLARMALGVSAPERGRRAPTGAAALTTVGPDEIHLAPVEAEPWADRAAAGRLARGLLHEGFRSAGAFAVPDLPGVRVQLFVDAEERLLGAVHEDPAAGHWMEIVERRSDGSSTTWTTAHPSGLAPRPRHSRVHAPGASPAELAARARRERGPAPADEVRLAEAEALFERAYAEETAWRRSQGVDRDGSGRSEQRAGETP